MVLKLLNTAFREHPFNTVRASELLRWHRSGEYERILAGTYYRRGEEPPPLSRDFEDAAGYYGEETRQTFGPLGDSLRRAREAFNSAFRGGGGTPSGSTSGSAG
jgi:hypothetical protein